MWVPTWGPSRVDVGADVGFVFWVRWSRPKDPCGGLHPGSILTPPVFAFLLPGEMAFAARFRGNKARSDHDALTVPAISCVRNML
jgi:hypothetical protein